MKTSMITKKKSSQSEIHAFFEALSFAEDSFPPEKYSNVWIHLHIRSILYIHNWAASSDPLSLKVTGATECQCDTVGLV